MIKELIDSISNNMKERASSPLLGAYTIVSIAFNWKFLVILFTSKKSGSDLVAELSLADPGLTYSLALPILIAVCVSIFYPTAKALISQLNSRARIMELQIESRLEELKDNLISRREHQNKKSIDFIIAEIEDMALNNKIGYHDLKRITDALPREDDLKIVHNKSI